MSEQAQVREGREARMLDIAETCDKVSNLHRKWLRQGHHVVTEVDGMLVRRLIRLLVEEWV